VNARQLTPEDAIEVVTRAAGGTPLAVLADQYGVDVREVKTAVDKARTARAASGRPQFVAPVSALVNGGAPAGAVPRAPATAAKRPEPAPAVQPAVKTAPEPVRKKVDQADLMDTDELVEWGRGAGINRAAMLAQRVSTAAEELRAMMRRRGEIDEKKSKVAQVEEMLRQARAELAIASGARVPPALAKRRGSGTSTATIREWARANGYQVKDLGLLPRPIVEAYQRAHS
jgi:hypothetical protein